MSMRFLAKEIQVAKGVGDKEYEAFATNLQSKSPPKLIENAFCVPRSSGSGSKPAKRRRSGSEECCIRPLGRGHHPIRGVEWLKVCVYDVYDESTHAKQSDDSTCVNCKGSEFQYDAKRASTICMTCGFCSDYHDKSSDWSQVWSGCAVRPTRHVAFTYRPQSHFSNWLGRIQGKEHVTIPSHITEELLEHFKVPHFA